MSKIVIQEIIHPKFRKKETRTLEKAFLKNYLTEAADKSFLDALKLKLSIRIPLYVFVEFFAYNSVGWTTMYNFEELKNPEFEEPKIWLSPELDLEKVSGSGQKVGEVGKALMDTINLLSKSSSEILLESDVQPINTLALNSMCLLKDFRLYISLGSLVFLHNHNESLSHALKQTLADILKEFEEHCKTNKKIRLI
jgi:hypothetical protein